MLAKLNSVIRLIQMEINEIVDRDAHYNEWTEEYSPRYLSYCEQLDYFESLDVNNLTDKEIQNINLTYDRLAERW